MKGLGATGCTNSSWVAWCLFCFATRRVQGSSCVFFGHPYSKAPQGQGSSRELRGFKYVNYVYVDVHVCVYIYIYICIYIYIYIYLFIYFCIYIYIFIYLFIVLFMFSVLIHDLYYGFLYAEYDPMRSATRRASQPLLKQHAAESSPPELLFSEPVLGLLTS